MSETFRHKVERQEHEPLLKAPEAHKSLSEHAVAEKVKEHKESLHEAQEKLEALAQAETTSPVAEKLKAAEKGAEPATASYINHELKSVTLNRELKNLQRKLSPASRSFSKVVTSQLSAW